MSSLLVISCNVRNGHAPDGANAWLNRRSALCAHLAARSPDLLGTQEVLADQLVDLKGALPAYDAVGVGREDGDRRGEFAAIFVRRDRFDVLDHGTFWLSETPDAVASVGWDSALTRTCTWARVRDRAAGRMLLVANTHFDHIGTLAQHRAAELLQRRLPALAADAPIVLTGDFNSTEDSDGYRVLTAGLTDAYRVVHPKRSEDEASFNGYGESLRGLRIDWILHSPTLRATAASIDRSRRGEGGFLSDHYLVDAVLE